MGSAHNPGLDSHSRSILLIDDSAPVREVLRVALESEGYAVLEADDGREGVRQYREHRPAVAIVFTLSGQDAGSDYQETARLMGKRGEFEKPVRVESLLAALAEVGIGGVRR